VLIHYLLSGSRITQLTQQRCSSYRGTLLVLGSKASMLGKEGDVVTHRRWRGAVVGLVSTLAVSLLLLLTTSSLVSAQSSVATSFVPLKGGVLGVLYQPPEPGPKSHVGIVIMHTFASYQNFVGCSELARRGYTVLCADGPEVNVLHSSFTWEDAPLYVAQSVGYMRARPDITSVLVLGHSIGGPLMAFYQNLAEHGPAAVCEGPEKMTRCTDALAGLPPADGVILLDSHLGDAFGTLTYTDPSVINESDPTERDTSLDMFNPANGFSPEGANYSAEFRHTYLQAQARRYQQIVQRAQDRLAKIQAGQGLYTDDEPFLINGMQARMWQSDLHQLASTIGPWPLLRADGSIASEIIHSVRVPSGGPQGARSMTAAYNTLTVKEFLSTHAIRVDPAQYDINESDITGVDWASSSTSAPTNVKGVSVPLIIMSMTGHYFERPDEIIFQHAASADKTLGFVEGAVHGLTPCQPCAQRFNGGTSYGDTVGRLFDYLDSWIATRFV
jgi:pimeloyl-ACP methyl ester carboxylesterase